MYYGRIMGLWIWRRGATCKEPIGRKKLWRSQEVSTVLTQVFWKSRKRKRKMAFKNNWNYLQCSQTLRERALRGGTEYQEFRGHYPDRGLWSSEKNYWSLNYWIMFLYFDFESGSIELAKNGVRREDCEVYQENVSLLLLVWVFKFMTELVFGGGILMHTYSM